MCYAPLAGNNPHPYSLCDSLRSHARSLARLVPRLLELVSIGEGNTLSLLGREKNFFAKNELRNSSEGWILCYVPYGNNSFPYEGRLGWVLIFFIITGTHLYLPFLIAPTSPLQRKASRKTILNCFARQSLIREENYTNLSPYRLIAFLINPTPSH